MVGSLNTISMSNEWGFQGIGISSKTNRRQIWIEGGEWLKN